MTISNRKGNSSPEPSGGMQPVAEDEEAQLTGAFTPTASSSAAARPGGDNRLSLASQVWDRGNKGWLDEAERLGRKYDKDNDGKIDRSDIFNIVEDVLKARKETRSVKKLAIVLGVVIVVLAGAMFGLTYAVVVMNKELSVKDGELTNAKTGDAVKTTSHGLNVEFTPSESLRRKLITGDRLLEEGEVVGYVIKGQVEAAWKAGAAGATVSIKLTNPETGETGVLVLNNDAMRKEDKEARMVIYTRVSFVREPGVYYTVVCKQTESRCTVTSDQRSRHSCFSADMEVYTRNNGIVRMKDLHVGEEVLTPGGTFETVYSIARQHHTMKTAFLRVSTEKESIIELTGNHLIYINGKKNPITASAVKVGDELITSDGTSTVITEISPFVGEGVYTPLTPSGKIVVNGFVASAYAVPVGVGPEYLTFAGIDLVNLQTLIHRTFIPAYQVHCRFIAPGQCVDPPRNEDGMADVAAVGQIYFNMFNEGNILTKFVFSALAVPAALATGVVCNLVLWFADSLWAFWLVIGMIAWKLVSCHKKKDM